MIDWIHHDSVTTANPPLPFEQYLKSVKKPQTNADRIRAMNDEELAKTIARKITGCYGCRATNELECAECVLEWLKKEVGNG